MIEGGFIAAIELSSVWLINKELLHPYSLVLPGWCTNSVLQNSQALISVTMRCRQFLISATQGPAGD